MFVVNWSSTVERIDALDASTVLLFVPDGMMRNVWSLVEELKGLRDVDVIVSADYHHGSCQLGWTDIYDRSADILVSVGHTPYRCSNQQRIGHAPVEFIYTADAGTLKRVLSPLIDTAQQKTSVAWSTEYATMGQDVVQKIGSTVSFKVPGPDALVGKGQIIGCHYESLAALDDEVSRHLIISDAFHAYGALLHLRKPVFWFNPLDASLRSIDRSRAELLRRRLADIEYADQHSRCGILVETRGGQAKHRSALALRDQLTSSGKQALLLPITELDFEKIKRLQGSFDFFVNTACPRIESRPSDGMILISQTEVDILLCKREFENIYRGVAAL